MCISYNKDIIFNKQDKELNMYVCGPTVYSDIHIGNTRPIIFFDFVARYFDLLGFKVNYVSNITDIDDKIIQEAKKQGISEKELVDKNIEAYLKVRDSLNLYDLTHMPRVTEYMDQIIGFIERLVENEAAYISGGDVYFDISKQDDYGTLSKRDVETALLEHRIENDSKKKNINDFVLWKETTEGINWESKFSKGRPGWHTECIVMINNLFNKTIDIHGGGCDLLFPHHENERIQAKAIGFDLANVWIHNGFIKIKNQKMSKSLGNIINAKDFIKEYGCNYLKVLNLTTTFSKSINITDELMHQVSSIVYKVESNINNYYSDKDIEFTPEVNEVLELVKEDLNFQLALDIIINIIRTSEDKENLVNFMVKLFGFVIPDNSIDEEIKKIISERENARKNKDFALSDKLRDEINKKGYEIFDSSEGTTWKKF
ncbi:MAG: cysteine--tRNA ligase [Mycoplasmatales bacterium]